MPCFERIVTVAKGVVAIAIKNGLTYFGIPNHEGPRCTIKVNVASILVSGIYQKPNAPETYLMQIQDFFHQNINDPPKIVMLGDFSMGGIDWDQLTTGSHELSSCEWLLNIMYSFSLSQVVKEPTGIQESVHSVLDLAFVSHHLTPELSVEDGISDH